MKTNLTKRTEAKSFQQSVRDYIPWLFGVPTILFIFICVWQPMLKGVVLSFCKLQGYRVVGFAGLENYKAVLGDNLFAKTLINTFEYLLWSIIIGFLPPVILAFMINELRHGKSIFKFITYLPSMVSMVATALIWTALFKPGTGGVANMLLARIGLPAQAWFEDMKWTIPMIILTATWQGMGGTALLFLASLQSVNAELYDAAMIDGAGIWKRIWNVTIPQIKGMILLMFVQQIIAVFQIMVQPMTMTGGGPMNESLTLCLQSYFYAFRDFKIEKSLALGVITGIILLTLTAFYHILNRKIDD